MLYSARPERKPAEAGSPPGSEDGTGNALVTQSPFTPDADGLLLAVRLTPRAGRTGLDGVRTEPDGRPVLCLRVAAPPVEGAANAALTAFVAKSLGLRKSEVTLVSGETARTKRLHLSGDPQALAARVTAWLGEDGPGGERGR